ncbi:unnamed protein product [Lactuca virosa]|uniref:Protein kinase domain-containing protein n=1 Tax=Lactuca virosa TaxID=75947 RepID=A0AAU9LMP8_9ASTR|nr:unnamed protein product [Lactuca virosa]
MALLKQLEHLKISLDVIKLATNNFGPENFVGVGGFGKVYKAEITTTEGLTKAVAIKRLDRRHGQGEREFLMEIMMLSRYRHKNLVSLLGFCDEGDEKILVYDYEFNGSLEKYLGSNSLTWGQRLKICIGAARGLEYLHNPLGTQQRVLHRDVKSANVLLDQFWEAKIADFGLSKIGPANQEFTFLVSNAVGTFGYCDPLYAETNFLTKESDVYSFGVVLFEVLCGRLCIGKPDDKHRLLTKLAQISYEQGKLDDIIFHGLRGQMESNSLRTYSSIAYRCLKREREERPTMAQVLEELELSLEYQESFQSGKPMEYEEIIQMADREQPLVYTNKRELKLLLSSGIRFDWGRRWFSLSKKEQNCEMISASEFTFQDPGIVQWIPHSTSRFSEVAKIERPHNLQIVVDVETRFLSPGITYAAYLVLKYCDTFSSSSHVDQSKMTREPIFLGLQFKFKDANESSFSHLADWTDNGWMILELCQFVSYRKVAKLELLLEGIPCYNFMLLEGIQFLPIEMQAIEEEPLVVVDNSNTMIDANWEQKLPNDYQYIIKAAKDRVPYNITNKEIYTLLSNGILTNKGQMLFSLDKNGIKCCMASARAFLEDNDGEFSRFSDLACFRWISLHESRFEKVAECQSGRVLRINCPINSHMLTPNTTYATYLVCKLPEVSHVTLKCPLEVKDINFGSPNFNEVRFIYLSSPKTPLIMLTNSDQDRNQRPTMNPLSRPKIESMLRQRKDGWMEAQIWTFKADAATSVNVTFALTCNEREQLTGLIVQGIEIRPKYTLLVK